MSYASANPWTVVIHSHYTLPAYRTMMSSWWLYLIALFAISVNNKAHYQIIIWRETIVVIHNLTYSSLSIDSHDVSLIFIHIYKPVMRFILHIDHFNVPRTRINIIRVLIKLILYKALLYEIILSHNVLNIFPCKYPSVNQVPA